MTQFLLEHWNSILAVLGPITAWIAGRKMQKIQIKKEEAESDISQIRVLAENLKMYQELLDDAEARFKAVRIELENELAEMKILNQELRKVISEQEKYIKKLKLKIDNYEKLEGQNQ